MRTRVLNYPARFFSAIALWILSGTLMAQQPDLTPQSGKASIVVYRAAREAFGGANTAYPIAFDEQWISNLPKGRYFAFPAWPGAHRIALALRMHQLPSTASENGSSSIIELNVEAGKTYYIKVAPGSLRQAGQAALELTTGEAAPEDFASSTPVDWVNDLLQGTLAEVRALSPGNASTVCGGVDWIPDIDPVKTSNFKRLTILHGTVVLQDDALVLQLRSAESAGLTIPYSDIASVEIKGKGLYRIVLVQRKNGHLDSFSVMTSGGGRVDRDATKACGEQLASRIVS